MLDVAIIGAGPRGLAAVAALASRADAPIRIHLFGAVDSDGKNVTGQGTPFDVAQPWFSRLNARSGIVDGFAPQRRDDVPIEAAAPADDAEPKLDASDSAPRYIAGQNFDAWAAEHGREEWVNDFPPRAVIGEYLTYCAQTVRKQLPSHITLIEYPRAQKVTGTPGAWVIETVEAIISADELLLTVGHAAKSPMKLTLSDVSHFADHLIDAPYPVSQTDSIPAGAKVATRGAGLSFIDLALALTEGRGGKFNEDFTAYTRSGKEPAVIFPTGLEGRFLDVKPMVEDLQLSEAQVAHTIEKIATATTLHEILDEIRELSSVALSNHGYKSPADTYDEIIAGEISGTAQELLRESIAAQENRQLISRTVVACTIMRLLQQLIDTLSNREWEAKDWKTLTAVMTVLNSFGFGPPPVNAQKILTLVESGLIDPKYLDSKIDALKFPEHVDYMVEALLAPSGMWQGAYPELSALEPILCQWADPKGEGTRTGVRTDKNGSVVDAHNEPISALAAIGRITEDWILSLDTLNFTVHPQLVGWAKRVSHAAANTGE